MNFFDSHCHLDLNPLANDLQNVLRRAATAEVVGMINVGTSLEGSQKSVEIAQKHPNIWATVGLHPHEASESLDLNSVIARLDGLVSDGSAVAIGEIGLDYFEKDPSGREALSGKLIKKQQALFIAQLELAKKRKLPVVVHTRDAEADTYEILKDFAQDLSSVEIHCFASGPDFAEQMLGLGFFLGFTGFVTFNQSKFDQIREAVKMVPPERLLVETDAPFLAPEPYRGKTNEPAFVALVAQKIACLKKMSQEEVAMASVKNAEKMFNINIVTK